MIEEHLPGGNTTPVVRIGDTVRRAAGPWTTTVQAYLRHLRAQSVPGVPEPFGVDDRGREIVSYLEGDVPHDTENAGDWLWKDVVLVEAGRFLRRLHDASVGFEPRSPTWRMPAHEPAEVVCHNDAAPYNMVFRDGHVVGLIDFDTCSPGPRIWDLAYLAYRLAPFIGEDAPAMSDEHRLARLDTLVAAYGTPFERADVLRTMLDRLDELATFTQQRAADTGRDEFHAHVALYRADRERIAALVAALAAA